MLKTSYSTKKKQEYSENFDAISHIAKVAKRLGMSYGRYVALYGGNVDKQTELALIQQHNEQKRKGGSGSYIRIPRTQICAVCGREFETLSGRALYCTPDCKKEKIHERKEKRHNELNRN